MALPPPSIDSTVVVTGASAGIGTELARELARRNYNVTLVARRRERLAELAEELRAAHGVHADVEPCDLGDAGARTELVVRLQAGQREVVGICNNAGFGQVGRLHELDQERQLDCLRVNVEALQHLMSAFLPRMVEQGTGAILNVASTAAFQPLPGFAVYAATKAYVLSLSEAVHVELGGTGVSVTALCPGFTRTEFPQAGGAEDEATRIPGFAWMDPDSVARSAVQAMVAGRRTAVPGLLNKAVSTSGRLTPRTFLLPVLRRVRS